MKKKSKKIKIKASNKNWRQLYDISKRFIGLTSATKKETLDVLLAIEEIFVNISKYAYPSGVEGFVWIEMTYTEEIREVIIIFEDYGVPFDPTVRKKPNLKIPYKDKKIGGLGIHMVKNLMDCMTYKHLGNKNYLKIGKKLKSGGE